MVRIKICGITRREDAEAAILAGADALGFIFVRESPRYIEPDAAAEIIGGLPPFVSYVGVFVNEKREAADAIAARCGLGAVQLHGNESPEYCKSLTRPVIKAFRMTSDFDENVLQNYAVSGFLFDTAVVGKMGGTGETFDWNRVVPLKRFGPLILAGGLNPENVSRAVQMVEPYGVDVSSGIEHSPGKKNHERMIKFIRVCKNL